jgi:dynein intermediate chain 2
LEEDSRFLCFRSNVQGAVIACNRKAQDKITASYAGHQGPIHSTARNPFFPKYFLSIGDWTARIWYDDLRLPIISSKHHPTYLVGGKWSPVRPGVFFTIKSDGGMDVWDYFYRQNDPTLSVKVSDSSLTAFDIQDSGRLVTVGDEDGSTTLYQMSEGIATMQQGEKQSVNQMLERETKQEKNLEQRIKERKFREKKNESEDRDSELANDITDDQLESIEEEFHQLTAQEMNISDRGPLEEAPKAQESIAMVTNGDGWGFDADSQAQQRERVESINSVTSVDERKESTGGAETSGEKI